MNKLPEKVKRSFLIAFGTFFLGLGFIGIFLPLLPTTPFLLLAAACYARGSQRFYNWLIHNRYFGKYIKNYREKKGIPLKGKVISITLLWITILCSAIFIVSILLVRVILLVISGGVTLYLLSLKTIR